VCKLLYEERDIKDLPDDRAAYPCACHKQLYVIVRGGSRTYSFRTTGVAGEKSNWQKIGDTDTISWDDAGDKAHKYRQLEANNIDPRKYEDQAKLKAKADAAKNLTFREVTEGKKDAEGSEEIEGMIENKVISSAGRETVRNRTRAFSKITFTRHSTRAGCRSPLST
jgi:hypothetical protein